MSTEAMRAALAEMVACLDLAQDDTRECLNISLQHKAWPRYAKRVAFYEAQLTRAENALLAAHAALAAPPAALAQQEEVSGAADPVGIPAGEQTGPVSAAPTHTTHPTDALPALGHPPIGLLTSGEVALLRAWAEDYARTAVAVGSAAEPESSGGHELRVRQH